MSYDPMSGRQVHPPPETWHRRPWPAMPDPLAECPECGNDFEPEDPTCDEWCPSCRGADRWDTVS